MVKSYWSTRKIMLILILVFVTVLSWIENKYYSYGFFDALIAAPFESRLHSFSLSSYDSVAMGLSFLTSLAWLVAGWIVYFKVGRSFFKNVMKSIFVYLVICCLLYVGLYITYPPNVTFLLIILPVLLITPVLGIVILFGAVFEAVGIAAVVGGHIAIICFMSAWLVLLIVFFCGIQIIKLRLRHHA